MTEQPSYRRSPKTQVETLLWLDLITNYGETAILAYLDWADVYGWQATPEDFQKRYLGVAWHGCEYIKGQDGKHYRFRN